MLPDYAVSNFRCFRRLEINKLRRINLVVGKNNVGKTVLLESLLLYATGANSATVQFLLAWRDDFGPNPTVMPVDFRDSALFHRPNGKGPNDRIIRLGPVTRPELSFNVTVLRDRESLPEGFSGFPSVGLSSDSHSMVGQTPAVVASNALHFSTSTLGYVSGVFGPGGAIRRPETWEIIDQSLSAASDAGCVFLPIRSLHRDVIASWWDSMALSDAETEVVNCLSVIEPRLERIALVKHPFAVNGRMPVVRLKGQNEPVPLKNLGAGTERLFQLALAVQRAAHKTESANRFPELDSPLLLVDEIENGIHYSALPDVWSFLFKVAKAKNLQVFATTHSWGCIEAFQQAAVAEDPESCQIISLQESRISKEIEAAIYEQSELPIIVGREIEVR
jgi:hypothetical protein